MLSAFKFLAHLLLFLQAIVLFFWIRKRLNIMLSGCSCGSIPLEREYKRLIKEINLLEKENQEIEKISGDTVELYDVTKEMVKSLDKQNLVISFRERLKKYMQVEDCIFVEAQQDLSAYSGYEVFALNISNDNIGHLLVKGIKRQDEEKFHILSQQLILGLKRAFLYRKVQELAVTDSLTGAYSRRFFLERLHEEVQRSNKQKLNFSFLMVDVDRFKDYNDKFGHLVGDVILKNVARAIKENIRQVDLVGKFGGDEFCAMLIETDKEEARIVAERIRKIIETSPLQAYDESLKVTVSIGIAGFPKDATEFNQIVEKADTALYQAKHSGRNKVAICK